MTTGIILFLLMYVPAVVYFRRKELIERRDREADPFHALRGDAP